LIAAIKATLGFLAGASLATLVLPVVGEAIATRPPLFPRDSSDLPGELGLAYEDVAFPTNDGVMLRGWFIPGEPDGPAVIYAHATGHDQRSGLSLVPVLHQAGYHVLLFSYRGHALSDGQRGRFTYGDAESRDVDAAVQYLHENKDTKQIAVLGHSVGAASAMLSAARNPLIGAVVAVAPFNCVAEVWHTSRPALVPRFLLDWTLWVIQEIRGFDKEKVCPLEIAGQIAPRPLLIVHGTGDRRITESQVRQLFGAAQTPKALWLVEGATHAGIRSPVLDQLTPEIISFLNKVW
jgi:alpha-beta hydrolase superfamily lysophospholipase